jgi:hypothetical protein
MNEPMKNQKPETKPAPSEHSQRESDSVQTLVRLGDYVHAAKYGDYDQNDPWRIGFVVKIIESKRGFAYVIGEEDGTWEDFREYRNAKTITKEQGEEWLASF